MAEDHYQQRKLWNQQTINQATQTRQIEAAIRQNQIVDPSTIPVMPNDIQVEKLKLILSTYQDGTGMLVKNDRNLPGWRDFERAVAIAFDGQAQESKHVFDVIVPAQNGEPKYGISCKMRGELPKSVDRTNKVGQLLKGRVSMEMSNAAKYFWNTIKEQGVSEENFRANPARAGIALVNLVKTWHNAVSSEGLDLFKSFYLVLEWDGKGNAYQLFQYSLDLPDPHKLDWYFPVVIGKDGEERPALRLCGNDKLGTIFEWYSGSGGQLKYYPLTTDALWRSEKFQLEPLPGLDELEYGIASKARTYFPAKWRKISK